MNALFIGGRPHLCLGTLQGEIPPSGALMADAKSSSKRPREIQTEPDRRTLTRDIIVIGGSAGAIEVIGRILSDISPKISAAIFVVVHTGETSPNYLVQIFSKVSPLPVQYASDREPIELGRVYVAPNDRHLLIKAGEMRVVLGPKENNFRPAVDPLFRTAATTYDGRVIGVIVSGSLDDGTHGALQIKRAGGLMIAQSPEDAQEPGMPESVIERAGADFVQPADEIGALLSQLVRASGASASPLGGDEVDVSEGVASVLRIAGVPPPSPFICPECKGTLWEVREGKVTNYRCHVGHGYSHDTLLAQQAMEIEQALWTAVRAFEERAELLRRTADRSDHVSVQFRDRLLKNAQEQTQMADVVRTLLVGPQRIEESPIGDAVRREYTG
jgi:two-component system chemotaxis response regulator CheB